MGIFKSYDIRGVWGREWDSGLAYRIGLKLPAVLQASDILVGHDARESSPAVFEALSRGILEAGCDVTDIGPATTPSVYFATAFYRYAGSVMITASHNPPEYNGLKISRAQAVPVGYGSGLEELERLAAVGAEGSLGRAGPAGAAGGGGASGGVKPAEGGLRPGAPPGRRKTLDIHGDYLRHLAPYREGIHGVKAVVDCSDGMASLYIHDLGRGLEPEPVTMYDTPDGRFPHHPPNPLVEANLRDLKARTLSEKADLGICFDGDADRVMFVDEAARFVSPDLITGLLGLAFFRHRREDHRGEVVSYDVRSSRGVVEYLAELGAEPVMCPVGHSFAKRLLRERDGLFGGELAGHYYFREHFYCDSALMAALLVLGILTRETRPLSELVAGIRRYHSSGEINFRVADKDRIIARVRETYRDGRLNELDGIRIDYPSWWFNLRKSNTEPLLRLVVEASTPRELEKRAGELKALFRSLDPSIAEE
jgi:phosphomannomutase